ncbi:MAG: OmpH family outer membrane protein [Bacteroidales bacterium]
MKKIGILLLVFGFSVASAQKIGYIEMERILEKMPEYEKANEEIESQVKAWEAELDSKFEDIESMYQEYVGSESSLNDEMRKQKQNAIIEAEKKANKYKDEKFGREGEITELQESKLKPIYDKVFLSAEKVAKENGFDYVFDKNADSQWIYTNPDMDITDKVINSMEIIK